jgi:hypothetical protein
MMKTSMVTLAFAAAIALTPAAFAQTNVLTNGPQTNPGDVSPNWPAQRNVIESQRYERLLQSSRGFREARMRKECGPVTDPQLHAQCIASFAQDEPYVGSSMPPRTYRSHYGR